MSRKWRRKNKRKHQQEKAENKVSQQVIKDAVGAAFVDKTPPPPPCHTGIMPVFMVGEVAIWAGRASAITTFDDWDLMILMSDATNRWDDDNRPSDLVTGCERAKRYFDDSIFRKAAPHIHINWPDFNVPQELDKVWWNNLLAGLGKLQVGNVAIGCTGGHGRTGTVLATLAALSHAVDANECPVKAIRDAYCRSCVETEAQVRYIENITGHKVKSLPSWFARNRASYSKPITYGEVLAANTKNEEEGVSGGAKPDSQDWQGSHHQRVWDHV